MERWQPAEAADFSATGAANLLRAIAEDSTARLGVRQLLASPRAGVAVARHGCRRRGGERPIGKTWSAACGTPL